MARIDLTSQRLFVEHGLTEGAVLDLDRAQANYLGNVLRFRDRDVVLVFNGRDGEWRAEFAGDGRRAATLRVLRHTRPQSPIGPIDYCFAPLKHARLDYLVQKAVEMGAGLLQPVLTRRTQVSRLKTDRMRANAIEAAEQCGILALPEIGEELRFDRWIASWPRERPLVFCDEEADQAGPLAALTSLAAAPGRIGVLIGPEGGFDPEERAALMALPEAIRVSLGPRILRADTAAVAALALVQAMAGDWR